MCLVFIPIQNHPYDGQGSEMLQAIGEKIPILMTSKDLPGCIMAHTKARAPLTSWIPRGDQPQNATIFQGNATREKRNNYLCILIGLQHNKT